MKNLFLVITTLLTLEQKKIHKKQDKNQKRLVEIHIMERISSIILSAKASADCAFSLSV